MDDRLAAYLRDRRLREVTMTDAPWESDHEHSPNDASLWGPPPTDAFLANLGHDAVGVGRIETRRAALEGDEMVQRCAQEQRHLDAGTSERAYWHHGYAQALRDVLDMLHRHPLVAFDLSAANATGIIALRNDEQRTQEVIEAAAADFDHVCDFADCTDPETGACRVIARLGTALAALTETDDG